MFEYAQLKHVVNESKEAWYLVTDDDEEKIEGKALLFVLNSLSKKKWELVGIDPMIGFIMKRRKRLF